MKFKAIIRVVKSIVHKEEGIFGGFGFDTVTVLKEPLIEAEDKADVKRQLAEMYPQFFQNGKVYEKETKDTAQFFYVLIYPLYNYEIKDIEDGEWVCSSCGYIHENKYISKPYISERLFGSDVMFCDSDDDVCFINYKKERFSELDFPDDENYVRVDSPNYIYKVTEKATGKCYIGKTKNAPFFRWWNHLTHSSSPFGIYLRETKLSDWSFEVLEILPSDTTDSDIFRIESEYIMKYNSIENGFNRLISNKIVKNEFTR